MYNFDFVKPSNVADALVALASEEAQALGGGQTLIPTMKQRLASPEKLVSLSGIVDMQGVEISGSTVTIGGSTTHANVASATTFAGLTGLAGRIGDPAVRNRGTIGGSLANNDPAACYPAAALATGATIVTNSREITADDYFQGMFTTALREVEIITSVRMPIPQVSNYQKFEQPASRFALVGVFVAKYAAGVRVAVTGASENGVFRWTEAEEALSTNFSAVAVSALSVDASDMITDLHGTKEYRANLVRVLTGRAVSSSS